MRQPPKSSAPKAKKKTVRNTKQNRTEQNRAQQNRRKQNKTLNQNNKAKSGRGNMTRFSRVFFEERAKTNQKRTQNQANKLTLAPTLRAIKPVKPTLRGKPFGERVFCPTGCEAINVISEPIDGGVKLFMKYPSAEIAARAKRGISILRSIKGKRVLLQALPENQKRAWWKTAIQLANHSSPSTIVLKLHSMRGGGEARLPPEFASRIFSSYPDFTSRLTEENIVEYWKYFMMNKFNKSKNTPLQLKDVQKRLTDRDLVSKGNTKNFQIYKQPYRIVQTYAAQIAKMANDIRMKTINTVNVATKRNNRLRRLRAERIIRRAASGSSSSSNSGQQQQQQQQHHPPPQPPPASSQQPAAAAAAASSQKQRQQPAPAAATSTSQQQHQPAPASSSSSSQQQPAASSGSRVHRVVAGRPTACIVRWLVARPTAASSERQRPTAASSSARAAHARQGRQEGLF